MKHLKKISAIYVVMFFACSVVQAQTTKISSTGRTTGHIATISVENTTNEPVTFEMGTAIIPSKEFQNEEGVQKSQPQIHTGNIDQKIAPGETIEIPVNGYCLDVSKPPLPAGESFVPADEWITAVPTVPTVPTVPEPVTPGGDIETPNLQTDTITSPDIINPVPPPRLIVLDDLPSSFQPLADKRPRPRPEPVPPDEMNSKVSEVENVAEKGVPLPPDPLNPGGGDGSGPNPPYTLILPGTDESFPFTVDISKHPKDAALIIFPIVESIILTYDSLQNAGAISTPFSQNEERQREAVVQQTIWLTTSLLQGESYGKNDFAIRMKEQLETASGTVMDEVPEEQQEQFDQGVEQFWGTFELVGKKAKVIKPALKFEDEIQKPGHCPCNSCEIVEHIKIFNNESGEEITEDTITWGLHDLRIEPPVFRSNCPDDCSERTTYQLFIAGLDGNYSVGNPNQHHYFYEKNSQDPGQVIFKVSYRCWCDGDPCAEIKDIQKELYFSQTNDCCDRLRSPIDGSLTFPLSNAQYVKIHRNRLKIRVNNDGKWIEKEFWFDIDIQSIFCNLDDDRVIGIVDKEMQSQLSENETNEVNDASSLGFAGPTDDVEGFNPSYSFRFMKSVLIDGEITEIQVSITVDQETCEYMVSVLFGNDIYEQPGNPLYPGYAFMQQLLNLNQFTSTYFWNRLLFLYTESLKYDNNLLTQAAVEKIRAGLEVLKNNGTLSGEEYRSLINRLNNNQYPLVVTEILGEIVGLL